MDQKSLKRMFFLKISTRHVEYSFHIHPDVLSTVDFLLQVWEHWKKNFSGKTSLKPSSAKVEWNDDNPTGNNLGKRPKIFPSKSDQFLQKKEFFDSKIFSENVPLDT